MHLYGVIYSSPVISPQSASRKCQLQHIEGATVDEREHLALSSGQCILPSPNQRRDAKGNPLKGANRMLGLKLTTKELEGWLRKQPCARKIDEIILHHTWRPTAREYKGEQTVKAIYDFHVKNQGWSDIGYHFLIAPDGAIWAGRPIENAGAHTRGRNAHSVGVCLIGNFDEEELTARQRTSLIVTLSALLQRFKLTPQEINFHRDYAPYKSCPGMKLDKAIVRAWVSELEAPSAMPSESDADDAATHPDVPAWAEEAVRWALEMGIVKGTPSGGIEGYRHATRAEVIVMLHRLWKALKGN